MSNNSYVTKINLSLADKLVNDLSSQGFDLSKPVHTVFAAKKKGVSCTLYMSGKLLVQGKDMAEFIEFYLEPHILKSFEFTYAETKTSKGSGGNVDTTRRIGIDESGKGDFFGPLCIAGVCADEEQIKKLLKIGVADSKKLTDKKIQTMAGQIKKVCPWYVVRINPPKYNELYLGFQNLNSLLAWGHATTIETLVQKTGCTNVIVDQFANEKVVERALAKKRVEVTLKQRPRAEEDVVVAAASILARDAFVFGIDKLSKTFGLTLHKGASAKVKAAAREFIAQHGRDKLPEVAKMHFKTAKEV